MTDSFDDDIDLNQICVERLVSDLRNNIAELASLRLAPDTARHVAAEEVHLGSALTALQMLMSHINADGRPMLRVVKR